MKLVDDLIDTLTDELMSLVDSDLVEGKAIELGDVTLVPISTVSVGLGGGGGDSEATGSRARKVDNSGGYGKGGGKGMGGGGSIRPVAIAVFTANKVDVVEIPDPKRKDVMAKLYEKVPDMVERIMAKREKE